MEMAGTQTIAAPRDTVYAALNDTEVLRQCIPGCETIEKISETEMKAKVTLKIGPMKVTFNGNVTLSEREPPSSYTITGAGTGGVAGFAKGTAAVRLESEGDATSLHYAVKADVGGKIAQLGARLIDGTARKLTGEFFQKLGMIVAPSVPQGEATADEATAVAKNAGKPGWFRKAFGAA